MKKCGRCGLTTEAKTVTFPTGSNTINAIRKIFGEDVILCRVCWDAHKYYEKLRTDEIDKRFGRKCSKCKQRKPKEAFYYRSERAVKHKSSMQVHSFCMDCTKEISQLQRTRNREIHLSNRYGISVDDFESLAVHGCEICKAKKEARLLVVDHEHSDGRFRGILCSQCNSALGLLGDDPERVFAAFYYLDSRKRGDVNGSSCKT